MNWKMIRIIDACLGIPILFGLSLRWRNQRKRQPAHDNTIPGRILLIKFWGIGNIAMILPSIAALRIAWPHASIDFLTLESNRPALETFGLADDIVTIDTGTPVRFLSSWRAAVAGLSGNNYDIIIDFEQFARFSALLAHQIGGRRTIGFHTRGQHRHRLLTDAVEYDDNIHITRSFFALVTAAGVTAPFPDGFTLPGMDTLRHQGRRLLEQAGISPDEPVVVMHIGTSDNFRERRWPPESFAHVANHLTELLGAQTVLTGLANESFLIEETINHLRFPAAAADFSGKLTFAEYTALIAAATMVISADTAAVHLASVLGVPVIGMYGPNTPHLYGPWGEQGLALYGSYACSPCITNFNAKIHTCRHPEGQGACMRAITGQDACNAIGRFLASGINLQTKRGNA